MGSGSRFKTEANLENFEDHNAEAVLLHRMCVPRLSNMCEKNSIQQPTRTVKILLPGLCLLRLELRTKKLKVWKCQRQMRDNPTP